jgi:hypothetical protein
VIQSTAPPTLDGLFRRLLARQPDALALADPPDKARVTGQPPQRLTFAQADRAIAALAAHFVEAGLPANSVIAVQLPNTIEFVLTVLAAHRAGLVAALLPQLWRQAELTVALNRTGARAIVTMSRIDGVGHADLAMNAAVEAFSIRHVCGFGGDLPEGMASLDGVMANGPAAAPSATQDGRRAAIISFDVTADGFRAVPRTHLNLIAGGLAIFLESGVPQGATILSAFAPSSFAGIASSLVTWLLSGGALALHHPFDADVLEQQVGEQACDVLVAPAPLALRLAEAGLLSRTPTLGHVIGLWRAPEQVASSPGWLDEQATLTDVYLFDHRRDSPDAQRNAGAARADDCGRGLRAVRALRQFPDRTAAGRLCRYRLCRAAGSHDRRDLHHRAALRHHGRRRLPFPGARSAGMGQAARTGCAADRLAGPVKRLPPGRPRPGQCPSPRSAVRTWSQPVDVGSISRFAHRDRLSETKARR